MNWTIVRSIVFPAVSTLTSWSVVWCFQLVLLIYSGRESKMSFFGLTALGEYASAALCFLEPSAPPSTSEIIFACYLLFAFNFHNIT